MNKFLALAAIWLGACGGLAYGQFAPSNPPAAFYIPPSSTMGTITGNTLTLTSLPNGFTVAGQIQVTVPAGSVSGILAQWTVIRRIDPTYSGSGIVTNTTLAGFSLPPSGTFGTTNGSVITDYRFFPGSGFVGGSQSTIPLTLVNGVDNPSWTSLSATSSPFTWTAGFFPAAVMQQQFTLFGNQTSGAGGVWTIDVPVTSITLPEPAGMLAITSFAGLALRRRRAA